jgi:hypothetical protein
MATKPEDTSKEDTSKEDTSKEDQQQAAHREQLRKQVVNTLSGLADKLAYELRKQGAESMAQAVHRDAEEAMQAVGQLAMTT